jgi:hypothetical protein
MRADGNAPAKQALRRFMEWWSEDCFCAGWLNDLQDTMARQSAGPDRDAFEWLVDRAGGWWVFDDGRGAESGLRFVPGTFADLVAGAARAESP